MELVVRGRNVEVPEHFRTHVAEKFARVERYDARIIRTDVELLHEKNPRQSDNCQRVEITCRVRGPVVRAEACADDFYAALDQAIAKVERRFRQAADRRRVHHGRHNPTSLAAATAAGALATAAPADPTRAATAAVIDGDSGSPRRSSAVPTRTGPGRTGAGLERSRAGRSRVDGAGRATTTARVESCARRNTQPIRRRSTRRCTRWSSSATTSTCSRTPRPVGRASCIDATATTTASSGSPPDPDREPCARSARRRPDDWVPILLLGHSVGATDERAPASCRRGAPPRPNVSVSSGRAGFRATGRTVMASRRKYVARHRHGRPGLFAVTVLMATWPPLRPLRRRWFGSSRAGRRRSTPARSGGVVVALPVSGVLSHRAA